MKTKEEKYSGLKLPGIPMLIFNLLFLAGIITLFISVVNSDQLLKATAVLYVILSLVLLVINFIFWFGFILIEPNEARVLIFFGEYRGTVKQNGYFWVNPFYTKKKLTLRARNLDAEPIKVNDKAGNPVMIGMVVV